MKSDKRLKVRQQAIIPWSRFEIDLFLAKAPQHLRTAILLLLYTGQRVADCATMDWTAFQRDTIRVVTSKTNEPLDIACHAKLRAELEARKTAFKGPILRNAKGRPYTPNALAKAIYDHGQTVEGFPANRSPHGLRYAAAGNLEEVGCTVAECSAILGHRTYAMAVKYMEGRKRSTAANDKLEQRA